MPAIVGQQPPISQQDSITGRSAAAPTGTFGPAYSHDIDGTRLRTKQDKIRDYMLAANARFQTLDEIRAALEAKFHERYPTPSVSAFLRHLKKKQFGSHGLEKRRRGHFGLWEYRLLLPKTADFTQAELFVEAR
jgi:hypothetical protein